MKKLMNFAAVAIALMSSFFATQRSGTNNHCRSEPYSRTSGELCGSKLQQRIVYHRHQRNRRCQNHPHQHLGNRKHDQNQRRLQIT